MVYMYAVSDPVEARLADPGPGLQAQQTRIVSSAELSAVVSDYRGTAPRPSEADLWAHERVVERLPEDLAVMPMRFGSLVADDAAVRELLSARVIELTAGLRRVEGAVELGLRAAWVGSDDPADALGRTTGSEYMTGLLDGRRRARDLADHIDSQLASLARASRRRLLVTPKLALSAAYLVDRERMRTFRDAVDELDTQIAEAEIICTGPWPPYSFAADAPEDP